VNALAVNKTIHDFGGFPQILFDQRWPKGSPACLPASAPRGDWTTAPGYR
jgi:hypothetical protein